MDVAVGAASWLLGKVIEKLSYDVVAAYMASAELGLNFENIKTELMRTQALQHEAQGRDGSNNPGQQGLLQQLSTKADEAEDVLDELHYFMIQDKLDGAREATPDVGGDLSGRVLHVHHAARHTIGNWLPCFSCSCKQDDIVSDNPHDKIKTKAKPDKDNDGQVGNLQFDRVAMSKNIKSVIEDMHSKCTLVSELLKINTSCTHQAGKAATPKRPITASTITQDKLYGRGAIFEKTVKGITGGANQGTLSVLPIVGPGGIGKTTFTQHIYNDKRTKKRFTIRIWVCVSTNFDVLKLTQEILSCIPTTEHEDSNRANETTNLDQLQKTIAKRLKSRKFLIVLDDIWRPLHEGEWKNLVAPFTKEETEGNMVLVTTRFPYIAEMVKTTDLIKLQGLEPDEFWQFFQACAFGEIKDEHDKDDLIDIARTVGRLLRNNLCQKHWTDVLENKSWEIEENDDDIMPALKISYDCLPYYLKQCFSYCALYPEDHKFDALEITRFWIAIGIIDSSGPAGKIDDIGLKYLEELVDNGFIMKGDNNSHQYYVMHDLFHELSLIVSSWECFNINSSNFKAADIPPNIRHLSITILHIQDKNFEEEMDKLKKRIDIGNLRSLMIFGGHKPIPSISNNVLKETFKEIKDLRVLFVPMRSPESLPQNFSKLIHLRYLKVGSPEGKKYMPQMYFPSTMSRFYHLKFLDLEHWHGSDC